MLIEIPAHRHENRDRGRCKVDPTLVMVLPRVIVVLRTRMTATTMNPSHIVRMKMRLFSTHMSVAEAMHSNTISQQQGCQ